MASSRYEIVIVGGNLGGVAVAHYLLKNTLPALTKLDSKKTYHVTIVSPSSHYFWKISAPRIMVKGGEDMYNQALRPLDKGFAQYDDAFNHVLGVATSTDSSARTITIKKNDETQESLHYDSLVIATGTTSDDAMWTLKGDHQETLDAFKTTKERLASAKTVLVAGGGAVGVESAGEIAAAFPGTSITILSGTDRLLSRSTESLSKSAEQNLKRLGVEVIHNVKTTSVDSTPDGKTEVKLSDGSEREVDVYINGTGGKPNSDWIPSAWLNEQQRVKVDKESLRVTGSGAERTYAIGDVADYSNQTWMDTDGAVAPISSSIGADIVKTLNDGKGASTGFLGGMLGFLPGMGSVLNAKKFSPMKGIFIVPMGPNDGVGILFGFGIPAFLVGIIKGKTYFLEMSEKQWNGAAR